MGERKPFFTDATIGGVHARVYTAQVPTGDAVQAVRPLEEVDRTLRDLTFALVLVGLGGVALAVWLGLLVARAALTPVKQLTDAAEHVARTRDLSRRIRADRTDELSRLGASFNTMLEALASSQACATPAGGGRLARAAHTAHQPAHEHRGAVVRRPAGRGPRAAPAGRRRPARGADGARHRPRRPRARRRAGARRRGRAARHAGRRRRRARAPARPGQGVLHRARPRRW